MIQRYSLPYVVERGVATALTCDIYSDAGTQQTATTGSIQILDGSEAIIAAGTAVTSVGPPATYTFAAADHTDRPLTDAGWVKWTLDGTVYARPLYLVRTLYRPVITDTDLYSYHSELETLLTDLSISDYSKYRTEADNRIQDRMLRMERRPWLVFDSYRIRRPHILLTLHLIFRDWYSSIGSGKYQDLANRYGEEWESAFADVSFRYDDNEDGVLDAEDQVSATAPITITAGARHRSRYSL